LFARTNLKTVLPSLLSTTGARFEAAEAEGVGVAFDYLTEVEVFFCEELGASGLGLTAVEGELVAGFLARVPPLPVNNEFHPLSSVDSLLLSIMCWMMLF
jgi:hypothetical protein